MCRRVARHGDTKADNQMEQGWFLTVDGTTGEYVVLTYGRIDKFRTIVRKSGPDKWKDMDDFLNIL